METSGRGRAARGEEALISFMGRGTCPAQEMNVAAEVCAADPERVTRERWRRPRAGCLGFRGLSGSCHGQRGNTAWYAAALNF